MKEFNLKRAFLYLLIASVTASALIGIGVLLFGNFGELETRVLLTTITVTVTSILGLACGAYLETSRGRIIPLAGIIFAALSAALWIIMIWYEGPSVRWFPRAVMSATVLALACSLISLLSLARLDKRFLWSRYALHISVWSLTAFLLLIIWWQDVLPEETAGRIAGVLSIIVAALTVVTPIFHRLSASETDIMGIDAEIDRLRARISELEAQKSLISNNVVEKVSD